MAVAMVTTPYECEGLSGYQLRPIVCRPEPVQPRFIMGISLSLKAPTPMRMPWLLGMTKLGSTTHAVKGGKLAKCLGSLRYERQRLGVTWDWHGGYSAGAVTDPTGPSSLFDRVFRGGSWSNFRQGVRVAYRGSLTPGDRYGLIGFHPKRTVQ